jgi:hypothetical protein
MNWQLWISLPPIMLIIIAVASVCYVGGKFNKATGEENVDENITS